MTEVARVIVALSLVRGIGRKTLLRLLSELPNESLDTSSLKSWLSAQALIDSSENAGIEVLTIRDRNFPKRLTKGAAPPAVIYVKGNRGALNSQTAVAIIGTRDPTVFGAKCASRLGAAFASEATVV